MMQPFELEQAFTEQLDDLTGGFSSSSQENIKSALRGAQELFGCVDLRRQQQIAEAFQTSPAMVKTLMRFIPSVKESVVEHEIICCTGPRCSKNGAAAVYAALRSELGIDFHQVTSDGKIRLEKQNCFKQCPHGPNLLVDGVFHHHMNPDKVKSLIKELRK